MTFLLAALAAVCLGLTVSQGQTGPTITQQPTSQFAAPGNTVNLTVTVSGAGPLTCQWPFNGAGVFIDTNTPESPARFYRLTLP
jgi:hypothetical protein